MQSLPYTLRLCALGTLLLPILAGCGGGGGGGNGNTGGGTTGITGTTGSNTGSQPTLSLTVPTATKGLLVTLAEDRATVSVGGTVNYTLTMTNPATAAGSVTINAPTTTTPPANLTVSDAAGNKLYTPIPPPPLDTVALAPGQSLTQTVPVQVFNAAGTYSATASFSFSDGTTPTSVGPLTVTAQ